MIKNILEEVEVTINKDHTITFSSYIPERKKKVDGDILAEKIETRFITTYLKKQY